MGYFEGLPCNWSKNLNLLSIGIIFFLAYTYTVVIENFKSAFMSLINKQKLENSPRQFDHSIRKVVK